MKGQARLSLINITLPGMPVASTYNDDLQAFSIQTIRNIASLTVSTATARSLATTSVDSTGRTVRTIYILN